MCHGNALYPFFPHDMIFLMNIQHSNIYMWMPVFILSMCVITYVAYENCSTITTVIYLKKKFIFMV